MKTLKSYVLGSWQEGKEGNLSFVPLVDPSTEEIIARASSEGIDFGAVLDYARQRGGPALRAMSFGQRAALLKEMSKVLRDHRDELLELSARNTGTTRGDGSFDIDGASGTLAYYASLGWRLGDRTFLSEGEGVQLAKTEGFYGRHILVPRPGVAVHINAFNFPAWGMGEKLACALLAGVPVVEKPGTPSALLAHRIAELVVESGLLPAGFGVGAFLEIGSGSPSWVGTPKSIHRDAIAPKP
jgi:oxepin-CoA hydrolase/3-oxo-5,6-dehydrosuberyl-CoA semialdehyde dehydrogenase